MTYDRRAAVLPATPPRAAPKITCGPFTSLCTSVVIGARPSVITRPVPARSAVSDHAPDHRSAAKNSSSGVAAPAAVVEGAPSIENHGTVCSEARFAAPSARRPPAAIDLVCSVKAASGAPSGAPAASPCRPVIQ